jgi:uncharacterized protein
MNRLTASDFDKWLKCPNWIYWDIFGNPADKGEVPKLIEKLREGGLLHEKKVVESLGPLTEVEDLGSAEANAARTLELMKTGVVIYQGTLIDDDWIGRPDLLVPIEGESKLGHWVYEPVDIKAAYEIRDAHKLQLVFYAHLLEKIQGVKPERGRIINAAGRTLEFAIAEAEPEFFEALAAILKICAGEKPDAFFTSACKDSPWFAACKAEAEKSDDPSLLYKLYKNEWKRLHRAGYVTVAQIAAASPDELHAKVIGVPDHRLDKLRLQAKSLVSKKVIRIEKADLPIAQTEIFFDVEGDPLLGLEYLFGFLVRKHGTVRYEKFLAERPEDEGQAWLAMCDFIERYAGTPIYHYGFYELEVVRRLSAKYGISKLAADALDPAGMIDLVRVVQRTTIFPLRFYSLKDIAKFLGFSWRATDASGANSVLWFQNWLETGDRAILNKIVDYNEDDVRATLFLKDWLTDGSKI